MQQQSNMFDKVVNRRNTGCAKYDTISKKYKQFTGLEKETIPMWIADMDFEVCPEIKKSLAEKVEHGIYGYPDDISEEIKHALKNWLKSKHNYELNENELVLSYCGVTTFSLAFQTLTQEGDGIIILFPVYYMLSIQVEQLKRQAVGCKLLTKNNKYEINFDDLEDKLKQEKNKMMVLCNPHNPTGRVWLKEEVARVAELCLKYKKILLSDDIFADLAYPDHKYTMAASLSEEIAQNTITIFTPSKAFNLSGLCSSLAIIRNEQMRMKFEQARNAIGIYELNIFGQVAIAAAYQSGDNWLNNLKEYLVNNYNFMKQRFAKELPELIIYDQDSGYLALLDFSQLCNNFEQVNQLLVDARIALQDIEYFYVPNQLTPEFRINFGCPRQILSQAIDNIVRVFNNNKK